tara:strand:+ start:274 stop:489 length:216 start_codon:yes stop_codon:yes gene_type:complete
MGILKWICKKFSCNSSCKYNAEMENCPKKTMENLGNIMSYDLSIKDVMAINKIISKKTINIVDNIQKSISL